MGPRASTTASRSCEETANDAHVQTSTATLGGAPSRKARGLRQEPRVGTRKPRAPCGPGGPKGVRRQRGQSDHGQGLDGGQAGEAVKATPTGDSSRLGSARYPGGPGASGQSGVGGQETSHILGRPHTGHLRPLMRLPPPKPGWGAGEGTRTGHREACVHSCLHPPPPKPAKGHKRLRPRGGGPSSGAGDGSRQGEATRSDGLQRLYLGLTAL